MSWKALGMKELANLSTVFYYHKYSSAKDPKSQNSGDLRRGVAGSADRVSEVSYGWHSWSSGGHGVWRFCR